jgi:hypothetical protein
MALASLSDSVVGAVVGVIAAAALGGLAALIRWWTRTAIAVIELPVSRRLADDARFRFGLRYVRDGSDQATVGQGRLLNTDRWFKRARGDRTRLVRRLRYAKNLGVQFKCFAEYSEIDFDEAASALGREEAIVAVARAGAPGSRRMWFLLTSYQTLTTSDDFVNNFIDPG